MAEKLLAKGEVGKHQCNSCLQLFEFVGNGKWIPATCPDCQKAEQFTRFYGKRPDKAVPGK